MPPDIASATAPGKVLLVGAGPGPADLMTVRAQRALIGAQAVLYDALVDPEVLDLAPAACLKIRTGKRADQASMRQSTINRLMLALARRGLQVVRLKGGDPSVFGRSGEEIAFLGAHGVEVEVVAGVTAASAAAAQFGFSLTQRGSARRLVLATVRMEGGACIGEGWNALAEADATAALYMARDSAGPACAALIAAGRPAGTPALAVENAGRPDARLIGGDLRTLPERLAGAGCTGPVVVLIGAVTARVAAAATQEPAACRAAGC